MTMLRRFGVSVAWSRVFNVVMTLFVCVGFFQLMVFVTWFDRTLPITVHFRVIETTSVEPGGRFKYWNFFVRHAYCDTFVQRWFITSDKVKMDIAPLPSFMPTEQLHVMQVSEASIVTPLNMPPGISQSCFRSTWTCNPLQRLWPLRGPETCFEFIVKPHIPPQSFSPIMLPIGINVAVVEGEG